MKIQNRIMYTSLLVIGCVLFARPNSGGIICDGQPSNRAPFIIRAAMEEEPGDDTPPEEDTHIIAPLMNLAPSCNLAIH